ncbi:9817_t:CDS:2, partial [Racocetra fulgida]
MLLKFRYLYYGIVDFKRQKKEIILELLVAADELGIQRLIDSVQEFLAQNCLKFLQSDLIKMLHFITCHNSFDNLKKASLITLTKHYKEFLRQDPVKLLHFIIHFKTLEKTLQGLIQLVRFHQINREEFMLEVWPFKNLLPDDLIEDILRCYLVSGAVPHYQPFKVRLGNSEVDSVLINKRIALLFTTWIDKKISDDKTSKKIRYNFNLLFRSSRDGLSSFTFHQKCDNKGATIVVGNILNTKILVGGYNPLDWNNSNNSSNSFGWHYKNAPDSFLFVINDPNNLKNSTLGRVNISNRAIFCNNNCGPTFGGGHDLYVPDSSNNWSYSANSYPNIGIPNSFTISDYEVFQ